MSYGLDYEGDMNMGGGGNSQSPSGGSGGHSQSGGGSGRKRYSQDEQTIQAVTISQILSSTAQDPTTNLVQLPDGRSLHHVSFVAAVRNFEDNSTHLMFTMEDGTGSIQVKNWLDDNAECEAVTDLRHQCAQDHIYLKIIGQIKDYDGNKVVLADAIRPLSTSNQITHHFLQVVYQSEMHKKGGLANMNSPLMAVGNQNNGMTGFSGTPVINRGTPLSYNNNGGGGGGDSALHQRILNILGAGDNHGSTADAVVHELSNEYSEEEIRREFRYLNSEGKIYTSTDEDHFCVA